jgi:general stress protein 26
MMRNAQQTIGNLIDKQGVAYIGSIDADGFPNIKAMLPPRRREGIRHLYFSTNTASMRAGQYMENPNACVYFCDRRYYRGVMLKGTMEVLRDRETREMVWREGDTMYYAKGVDDPDYSVLRFTAREGRYYRNFGSEDFTVE